MNRKTIFVVMITLLMMLLLVAVTGAQNIRPVNADTYWDANAADTDVRGGLTNIQAEGSGQACDLTKAGLLKWNIGDIADTATLGSAILSLNSILSNTGTGDTSVLTLFEAPDGWDDTTPNGSLPDPNLATTPLATVTGPFPTASNVVFTATDTDPMIQYIQDQITGDGVVSFWVKITAGCNPGGTGRVVWNSKEAGTSTLELWTGPLVNGTPTAVEMSTFSADNTQSVNWALYVGLAGLAVLVLGAVGYGYSRTR